MTLLRLLTDHPFADDDPLVHTADRSYPKGELLDLVEAKAGYAKPVYEGINARVRKALQAHLVAAGIEDVANAVDLVLLAPLGLKYDDPSTAKFRRRLQSLAASVAASAS